MPRVNAELQVDHPPGAPDASRIARDEHRRLRRDRRRPSDLRFRPARRLVEVERQRPHVAVAITRHDGGRCRRRARRRDPSSRRARCTFTCDAPRRTKRGTTVARLDARTPWSTVHSTVLRRTRLARRRPPTATYHRPAACTVAASKGIAGGRRALRAGGALGAPGEEQVGRPLSSYTSLAPAPTSRTRAAPPPGLSLTGERKYRCPVDAVARADGSRIAPSRRGRRCGPDRRGSSPCWRSPRTAKLQRTIHVRAAAPAGSTPGRCVSVGASFGPPDVQTTRSAISRPSERPCRSKGACPCDPGAHLRRRELRRTRSTPRGAGSSRAGHHRRSRGWRGSITRQLERSVFATRGCEIAR